MRKLTFVLLAIALLVIGTGSALAQATPDITSFTTTAQYVSKKALENRTARIPVSWTTQNRPLLANLVFEQVLPDGSTVNVELPRLFPWVNSNGDGIAAPIMPTANAGAIVLKVTLVGLIDGTEYDHISLSLPISDTNENGPGTGNKPALTRFTTTTPTILRSDLDAGTARIPVAWTAINRPITATLVFEQLLASGEAKNIELPRATPWVNSSDKGMVAPVTSSAQHNEILLRVRLIDVLFQRVYDVRTLVVNVSDGPDLAIPVFHTSFVNVVEDDLKDRKIFVPVSWLVNNRPNNSNLIFEQIMPSGEILNVELPRDFVIVPSQGVGSLRPFPVNGQSDRLRFQLRLVDLTSRATLARNELTLPIVADSAPLPIDWVVVTGDACYSGNFPTGNRMAVGDNGRVVRNNNDSGTSFYTSSDFTAYIDELKPDETFTLLEGPICRYSQGATTLVIQRVWKLRRADGREGWALEFYKYDNQTPVLLLVKADTTPIPTVQINSFTVSPAVADYNQDVTVSWDIANASRYGFTLGNGEVFSEAEIQPQGSMTRKASEVIGNTNPTQLSIFAADSQDNFVTAEAAFSVNSAVAIKSFTVTPENPASNGSITLSWELEGTSQAKLLWNQIYWQAMHTLTDVTTTTGSYQFTLPNEFRTISFSLVITDPNGVAISKEVSVQPSCPYTFFVADSDTQDDHCPDGNARAVNAAYQSFERGFMVWTEATEGSNGAAVTAFFNNGTLMQVYDNWTGQTYDLGGTPPDGLSAPERGFGWAWSQNAQIRDGLGWATGAEQSYSATRQGVQAFCSKIVTSTPVYQTLPDGRTVRFSPIYTCGDARWGLVN